MFDQECSEPEGSIVKARGEVYKEGPGRKASNLEARVRMREKE